MPMSRLLLLIFLLLYIGLELITQTSENDESLYFTCTFHSKILGHYQRPMYTLNYDGGGSFAINAEKQRLIISDSAARKGRKPFWRDISFGLNNIYLKYAHREAPQAQDMNGYQEFFWEAILYSPLFAEQLLDEGNSYLKIASISGEKPRINVALASGDTVAFHYGTYDELTFLTRKYHDDLYGDVIDSIMYLGYTVNELSKPKISRNTRERSIPAPIDSIAKEGYIHNPYGHQLYPTEVKHYHLGILMNHFKIKSAVAVSPDYFAWKVYKPSDNPDDEVITVIPSEFETGYMFFDIPSTNSRISVVDLGDGLMVFGAPVSSEIGEALIAEIEKAFQGKPTEYLFVGHHHPHYLGGARPFIARGAKVIIHDTSSAYIKHLSERTRSIHPDRQSSVSATAEIITVTDSLVIKGKDRKVIFYYMGENSGHTEDYTIAYLPEYKVLYQDDLLYGHAAQKSKPDTRDKALFEFIKLKEIKINTIIQNWPHGEPYKSRTVLPYREFENLFDK